MKKIVCLVLILSSLCLAQGFDFMNSAVKGGTRSFAMGGCFTAIDYGIDAMLGNPAGLAGMNSSEILLNGRMIVVGDMGFDDDFYEVEREQKNSYNDKINIKPYSLGIAFPLRLPESNVNITGALGYRCYYDMSSTRKREYSNYEENTVYESTEKVKGLLNVLSAGFGVQLSKQVNIGVVFNVPLFSKYETITENENLYSEAITSVKSDISGDGFFQLGTQINMHPRLSLGAAYFMGHKIKYHDREIKQKNDDDYRPYESEDSEIEHPDFWSVGFQFNALDDLLLTTEIQSFPWEDTKSRMGASYYKTGKDLRVGLEYGREIKLRFGYYTNQIPLNDDGSDFMDKYGFSGGAGFNTSSMRWDVSGVYRVLSHTSTVRTIFNPESVGEYEYKVRQFLIYASVIYTFDFGLGF